MTDPGPTFDLERFVVAQAQDYSDVLRELRGGYKETHWMWYVFPQIDGLGTSPMSRQFAISSLDEARAYLDHPVLGPRLLECTRAVNGLIGKSALRIFGTPDNLKFRSSMTLFAHVAGPQSVFSDTLRKYFDGPDPLTLRCLSERPPAIDKA